MNDMSPNLWCLCDISVNPEVLHIDDQHISFTVMFNGFFIGISIVYASTCYITRRNLWNSMQGTFHNIKPCSSKKIEIKLLINLTHITRVTSALLLFLKEREKEQTKSKEVLKQN